MFSCVVIVQRKYITAEESGIVDAGNTFGSVRPRHEVTEDVAVSTVPAVSMGKFSLDQVREWLLAVAKESVVVPAASGHTTSTCTKGVSASSRPNYETQALIVYDHIANLLTKPATVEPSATSLLPAAKVRELPKSTIFGTVTVSSRLKRYRSTSTSSTGSNGNGNGNGQQSEGNAVLRAGQHLLRVQNIAAALHRADTSSTCGVESKSADSIDSPRDEINRQAEILFREAVIRRSQYDASLQEYERLVSLQNTRMRIEDQISTNFQASVLQARKPAATSAGVKTEDGDGAAGEAQASKRARTESHPTAAATASSAAVVAPAMEEESLDFDLEEFVGGPVATVDKSRYASVVPRAANGHSTVRDNGASSLGSAQILSQRSMSSASSDSNTGIAAGTGHASGVQSSAAATATGAAVKKVGMKPRPKIVIS